MQVAERAVEQAQALAKLTLKAVKDAEVMARNAELERSFMLRELHLPDWDTSPQAKRYRELISAMEIVQDALKPLQAAAGFNPKDKLPRA
jgi:hypothetical protein